MAFFRQYIAPLLVVLVFLVALFVVSIRIFLPEDMAAPAPVEETTPSANAALPPSAVTPSSANALTQSEIPPSLSVLIKGTETSQL